MRRNHRLAAAGALLSAGILAAAIIPGQASSHREAPLISQDPVADSTDVYTFVSPDKQDTVTIATNWIPFENPAGGPNFSRFGDDVRYDVNVDNNGDTIEDIVYEFRFKTKVLNPTTYQFNGGAVTSLSDTDLNVRQTYSVTRVEHGRRTLMAVDQPVVPDFIGPRSMPNYAALVEEGIRPLPKDGGTRVFVGQRDDSFFVDLGSVFDLGGLRPLNEAHAIKRPASKGVDGVAGFNVATISLQIPITRLTSTGGGLSGVNDPHAVIGVWTTSYRQSTRVLKPGTSSSQGNWVQVSRLGMPLVNEVVAPLGAKDLFNSSEPKKDTQFLGAVTDPELGRLIPIIYPGVNTPPAPRTDLVTIFLTGIPGLNQPPNVVPGEMLRLNMAIMPTATPSPLGLLGGDMAGFPNGRRLGDDVTDIELRAVAGGTPFTPDFNKSPNNILGDGVDSNDVPFLPTFPYQGTPHNGYGANGGS